MVVGSRPPFSSACNAPGCGKRIALVARTFDDARLELLAAGWIERHRKGGARRSEWTCPTHGAPALPTRPISATTAHGVVQDPPPLPAGCPVVAREAGRLALRGAFGTVTDHLGGELYAVAWEDIEGAALSKTTLRRTDLLIVR